MTITIKDETFAGNVSYQTEIDLETEIVTIEDIIKARINKEVDDYNNRKNDALHSLVRPTEAEAILNSNMKQTSKSKIKHVNATEQIELALEAFKKNAYFILIDSMQAESLEQIVMLNNKTGVSFVRLTPLVGG